MMQKGIWSARKSTVKCGQKQSVIVITFSFGMLRFKAVTFHFIIEREGERDPMDAPKHRGTSPLNRPADVEQLYIEGMNHRAMRMDGNEENGG